MTLPFERWWGAAPELIETQAPAAPAALPSAQFSGVMTNPMLMPAACRRLPPAEIGESGWDLYLMCRVRSADYLESLRLRIPFCVQIDPRSAFDALAMLEQLAEVPRRVTSATIKVR